MGGCLLYPNPLLQFPSFSALTFRKPLVSIKEICDRRSSSVRAETRKGSHGPPQPDDFDAKSSLSPNKEEILALFKRIQSSIAKGETVSPKKRNSKIAEDNPSPSAESILEVLHQSRTQRKGKTVAKKGGKFVSAKKEESAEYVATRPPSSFTRRSPITTLSSPREEVEPEKGTVPEIAGDETEVKNEEASTSTTEEAMKLGGMKLPQLKEVAKSKGIKGYSKLKKSELVELLLNS